MLKVGSNHRMEDMEGALSRAAQRHGAHVLASIHLGHLLKEESRSTSHDAVVFAVCQSELYAALLSADVRFAAFLPCRIAAIRHGDGVTLESISPREFCRILNRSDLDRLVLPLETLLRELMEEAARPDRVSAHSAHAAAPSGPGAREEQMSMRGSLPQRIDCFGTKIEDLAGTGEQDAPGG